MCDEQQLPIYTVDLSFILSSWHLSTISLGKSRLKSSSRRALKRERSHQREEVVPLLCSWISDLPWESRVAHFPQEKWVGWALVWETWPWKTVGGSGCGPPSVEWARGVRVQRPPDCQLPQSLPSWPQSPHLISTHAIGAASLHLSSILCSKEQQRILASTETQEEGNI